MSATSGRSIFCKPPGGVRRRTAFYNRPMQSRTRPGTCANRIECPTVGTTAMVQALGHQIFHPTTA